MEPTGTTKRKTTNKKLNPKLKKEFDNLASSASIPNYYEFVKKSDGDLIIETSNPNINLHGISIPARGLIIAPSGSGKTNFLVHMLNCFNQGEGTFTTIQICCSSKAEPLYEFIERRCPGVIVTEGIDSLPKLDKDHFDKRENHLIILDDLVLAKNQDRVCKYYMMCRKFNVTIFYLSQKFFTVPLFIRQNATLLFLLDLGNKTDVKRILSTISLGVDLETLIDIYKYATSEPFTPLRINITERNLQKKFKKGLIEDINFEE